MYLIPKPKDVEEKEGCFFLSMESRIVLPAKGRGDYMVQARILRDCIRKWAGLPLTVSRGEAEKGDICLKCDPSLGMQAYCVEIDAGKAVLSGGDAAGLLYAVETLCQVVEQSAGALPCMRITDAPAFLHRGYYLDQARGRVLKLEQLKQIVDRLCRYKINEFQLYVEHTYLFRNLSEMWRAETPLTAEDILELDRYCRDRQVELIPSLASFGHLYMLLSTKSYGGLCEMEHSWNQPFSFWDRLRHHTINVADSASLELMKGMLEEYMALFTSDRFNICADETFDLGKGKAETLAKDRGVHRIYVDFVKELCTFLIGHGKQPMFWGDILSAEPELIKELPKEVICLNWGYSPDQREEDSRRIAETGAIQYLCPGVAGWDQWMNRISDSYQNIVRMCSYAEKYHASGILNTDWGDFGHVNFPDFSIPGLIYGAAFSWNLEIIPKEEIDRQISYVEFHDGSERLVGLLSEISGLSLAGWHDAVLYYEAQELGGGMDGQCEIWNGSDQVSARDANVRLEKLREELLRTAACMDTERRGLMWSYDVCIRGIQVWNEVGAFLGHRDTGKPVEGDAYELAARLEAWFMAYKELWRVSSREGDLQRISAVVFWHADRLRGREIWHRRDGNL